MSDRRPFHGHMDASGKPILDDSLGFEALKRSLAGKPINVYLFERMPEDDLTALRGYFHGVCLPKICRAAGFHETREDLDMVKQGLKEKFLTQPDGTIRSTESLTRSEYAQFVEDCRWYAADTLHVVIPDPQ